MKWQAVKIGQRYPVKLNTHDEHAITVIDRHIESATQWMTECMSSVPKWLAGLPVACEVSAAPRYGDC